MNFCGGSECFTLARRRSFKSQSALSLLQHPSSLFPISRLCPLSLIPRLASLIFRPSSLVSHLISINQPSSLNLSSFFSCLPSLSSLASHPLFLVLLLLPLVSHPSSLILVPQPLSFVLFDHNIAVLIDIPQKIWRLLHRQKTLSAIATPYIRRCDNCYRCGNGRVDVLRNLNCSCRWTS